MVRPISNAELANAHAAANAALSQSQRTNVMLPPTSAVSQRRSSAPVAELRPLDARRMAAAERAEQQFAALCAELAEVMRRPLRRVAR